MPTITILAGPNGAGKSTVARTLLRDLLAARTFVNAEEIGRGLAGFVPERAAPRADNVKLAALAEFSERRVDFGFETTLAGNDFRPLLASLHDAGYRISLIYVWVVSADLAVQRARCRAEQGGQTVDEPTVRERYMQSLEHLFRVYLPLVDDWQIHDTSAPEGSRMVAEGRRSMPAVIHESELWAEMRRRARG